MQLIQTILKVIKAWNKAKQRVEVKNLHFDVGMRKNDSFIHRATKKALHTANDTPNTLNRINAVGIYTYFLGACLVKSSIWIMIYFMNFNFSVQLLRFEWSVSFVVKWLENWVNSVCALDSCALLFGKNSDRSKIVMPVFVLSRYEKSIESIEMRTIRSLY